MKVLAVFLVLAFVAQVALAAKFDSAGVSRILGAHNYARMSVDPPAAQPMKPIQWSDKLANVASQWAENAAPNCYTGVTNNPWAASAFGAPVGESIGYAQVTDDSVPDQIVTGWSDSADNYNFTTNSCADDAESCLPYTQMIWQGTQQVGCGHAVCQGGAALGIPDHHVVVCNYYPPGNGIGMWPFQPAGADSDSDNDASGNKRRRDFRENDGADARDFGSISGVAHAEPSICTVPVAPMVETEDDGTDKRRGVKGTVTKCPAGYSPSSNHKSCVKKSGSKPPISSGSLIGSHSGGGGGGGLGSLSGLLGGLFKGGGGGGGFGGSGGGGGFGGGSGSGSDGSGSDGSGSDGSGSDGYGGQDDGTGNYYDGDGGSDGSGSDGSGDGSYGDGSYGDGSYGDGASGSDGSAGDGSYGDGAQDGGYGDGGYGDGGFGDGGFGDGGGDGGFDGGFRRRRHVAQDGGDGGDGGYGGGDYGGGGDSGSGDTGGYSYSGLDTSSLDSNSGWSGSLSLSGGGNSNGISGNVGVGVGYTFDSGTTLSVTGNVGLNSNTGVTGWGVGVGLSIPFKRSVQKINWGQVANVAIHYAPLAIDVLSMFKRDGTPVDPIPQYISWCGSNHFTHPTYTSFSSDISGSGSFEAGLGLRGSFVDPTAISNPPVMEDTEMCCMVMMADGTSPCCKQVQPDPALPAAPSPVAGIYWKVAPNGQGSAAVSFCAGAHCLSYGSVDWEDGTTHNLEVQVHLDADNTTLNTAAFIDGVQVSGGNADFVQLQNGHVDYDDQDNAYFYVNSNQAVVFSNVQMSYASGVQVALDSCISASDVQQSVSNLLQVPTSNVDVFSASSDKKKRQMVDPGYGDDASDECAYSYNVNILGTDFNSAAELSSQLQWTDTSGTPIKGIMPIDPIPYTLSGTPMKMAVPAVSSSSSSTADQSGLASPVAVAALVIGCVAVVLALAVVALLIVRRSRGGVQITEADMNSYSRVANQ